MATNNKKSIRSNLENARKRQEEKLIVERHSEMAKRTSTAQKIKAKLDAAYYTAEAKVYERKGKAAAYNQKQAAIVHTIRKQQ